ncbi:MAG: 4Fe-4S dicluster domain-containing protein [Candidatus Limnocylindrales bacterium]
MITQTRSAIGFLPRANFQQLIDLLTEDGRTVIGPTVADGAIVYGEVRTVSDLPVGMGSEQTPGRYRLVEHGDQRYFAYAVGPTAWKRFVFPPTLTVSESHRDEHGHVTFAPVRHEIPKLAFLGVRACELAALGIEDRVFLGGPYTDEDYRRRRANALVIAVQCAEPASTCFCTSMGTGPGVRDGHDVSLVELDDGFVVTSGSPEGAAIVARLDLDEATGEQITAGADQLAAARERIGDPLVAAGLHDRLLAKLDSPHWAEIAERCLACTNCTAACPTCFCTSVSQVSDLDGHNAVTERRWDFCFTEGFSSVALGGNFRPRIQDRYRQWLTHKFATWIDQFGTSGCVGCGRCITWCPVGIDVREELNVIAPPPEVSTAVGQAAEAKPPQASVFRVEAVHHETRDTVTLSLSTPEGMDWAHQEGEFVMVSMPAIGSIPISISRRLPTGMELTIRAVGPASTAVTALEHGAELGLSAPLGHGWPVAAAVDHDVVIVGGGMGLPPLRPIVDEILAHRARYGDVHIYHGARTPADLLYREELAAWAARGDLEVGVTVDHADATWLGRVGVVTHLFDQARWDGSKAIAFVCGPERMIQATVNTLAGRGITPDRIFISMERHMECGVGLCGHCQVGPYFVCKDGPVFSLAQLGDIFGREGI